MTAPSARSAGVSGDSVYAPSSGTVRAATLSPPGRGLLRQRPVPRRDGAFSEGASGGRPTGVQFERRRRDGLGLLPRVADPRRRQARHRANQLLGFGLIVFGGAVMGCSLGFTQRGEAALGGLALLLGLVTLAQGIWLVGRQERRGRTPRPGTSRPRTSRPARAERRSWR